MHFFNHLARHRAEGCEGPTVDTSRGGRVSRNSRGQPSVFEQVAINQSSTISVVAREVVIS